MVPAFAVTSCLLAAAAAPAYAQTGSPGMGQPGTPLGEEQSKPEGIAEKAPSEPGQQPTTPVLPPWPGYETIPHDIMAGYTRIFEEARAAWDEPPDMLIVQTDKDPAGAGWLTWLPLAPFSNGYGGRKLTDDVVDLALLAVFGDPFGADPDGAAGKEGLTTDNVSNDSPISAAFPYVGAPN